jgi:hypothetical protein
VWLLQALDPIQAATALVTAFPYGADLLGLANLVAEQQSAPTAATLMGLNLAPSVTDTANGWQHMLTSELQLIGDARMAQCTATAK